jgi:hypothetical protein
MKETGGLIHLLPALKPTSNNSNSDHVGVSGSASGLKGAQPKKK